MGQLQKNIPFLENSSLFRRVTASSSNLSLLLVSELELLSVEISAGGETKSDAMRPKDCIRVPSLPKTTGENASRIASFDWLYAEPALYRVDVGSGEPESDTYPGSTSYADSGRLRRDTGEDERLN